MYKTFLLYALPIQDKQYIMKKHILLFIVLLKTSNCFAHIAHYSNLSNLQFDINRNGNYVGYHHIDFDWSENGDLKVTNVINFKLKSLV